MRKETECTHQKLIEGWPQNYPCLECEKERKETDREKLIRYCLQVNKFVEPFGHSLLWDIKEQERKAIGTCDCRQRVEVGLDDKEDLTHIGKPIQCPVKR